MNQSRHPAGGFTLVEVLMATVIMAIAAAIVVPYMIHPGQMGAQAAGRIIVTDLLYAQNEAIAAQAVRRVVFDLANNRYRLTDESGTTLTASWIDGSSENYVVDFTSDQRFIGVSLAQADFNGAASVEFDPLGAPSEGGSIEIDGGGQRFVITVAPMTGRVTIGEVVEEAPAW